MEVLRIIFVVAIIAILFTGIYKILPTPTPQEREAQRIVLAQKEADEAQARTKIIVAKNQGVGSGISGAAFVFEGKLRPTVTTEYYLVAADGTYVTVSVAKYELQKIGEPFEASSIYAWRR